MADRRPTLDVRCPCCSTRLLVDAGTGVVLREDRPKKAPAKSFEAALHEEQSRKAVADSLFGSALEAQKHEQDLLERKFEEAMKKAAQEPPGKPLGPFDQD